MNDIINDNYESIVARGLITSKVTITDFIHKIYEELAELEDALYDLESNKPTKEVYDHFNEELADVILTALNLAKHLDIDIESELRKKIYKNFKRTKTSNSQINIFDLGA